MAVLDRLFDPSNSALDARIKALIDTAMEQWLDPSNSALDARIKALIDTAMEQWLDSAGGPVPAQISSRSPITQARTSRVQDSHDSEGTGAVKREDRSVLKYEAAGNVRTPPLEAQGESKLVIPESNGRSLPGNAKRAEPGKLSAKPTLKGSGHTTPLTAERKALPLCSTFGPVSSDGPIAIYSSGEEEARNVDQENRNMSGHAEVSPTKRKADAIQKTCQLHRENTATSRSGRHIRGLKERPDMQDLPNPPPCSPNQEAMPGEPCTTRGLHLDSEQWCDRKYQSVVREDHSAAGFDLCHTQSRNSHDCEEVETDEIEVQPAESSRKRRKIEQTQALDSDKLSDDANVPHILFVENARLPADIERRGYPRLIHIEHFTRKSNTDNLTMADFVATILFHHNPQTLTAFIDEKRYPKFGFAIRRPSKAQAFEIERERKGHGVVVKVHARSLTITRG